MQLGLKGGAVLATVFLLAILVVNAMAVLLPINHLSTGEVSGLYPNLFVPAGFTFSIWSVIYLLLLAFCGFALWHAFTSATSMPPRSAFQKTLPLFVISCVFNGTWIFLWHYLQVQLSLLIMIALLITLILLYQRLYPYRSVVFGIRYIVLFWPFSVYLGWISVALIANVTAVLVSAGWTGGWWSASTWAIVMILTATLLGLYFIVKKKDLAYGLVICWALYGIYFKQANLFSLSMTALIGIGILLSGVLYRISMAARKDPEL